MRIISFLIASLAAASHPLLAHQNQHEYPRYFSDIESEFGPHINSIELNGDLDTGNNFRVIAEINLIDLLEISAYINDIHLGSVRISSNNYNDIDLSTLRVNFDRNSRLMYVSVKYGEITNCFVNYDGRNRLFFYFQEYQNPELYDMHFDECRAMTRSI